MKTGFIDCQENGIFLHIFEKQAGKIRHTESIPISSENILDESSLSSLMDAGLENVFLSVPPGMLTLRDQSFPFHDEEKINETLAYELDGMLLGNVSDYAIDHITVNSSETDSNVLAVCLEKSKLQEILNTLSSVGIEPRVVTSLDLRLSGGDSSTLFQSEPFDNDVRASAALEEIINPSVNLRQDELAYKGDIEKFRKSLRFSSVLVLIILAMLAAGASIKAVSLRQENENLQNTLKAAYRQIFPEDKKIIDINRQFEGKMNVLLKKKAALSGIPLLETLRETAIRNNGNVTLKEFSANGKSIAVRGIADSFKDVESLKTAYSLSFDEVKVMSSETTSDSKINFTIVMREKTA